MIEERPHVEHAIEILGAVRVEAWTETQWVSDVTLQGDVLESLQSAGGDGQCRVVVVNGDQDQGMVVEHLASACAVTHRLVQPAKQRAVPATCVGDVLRL